MNKNHLQRCYCLVSMLVFAGLTGCVSTGGGFGAVRDSGPSRPIDLSHVPDAVPKVEPRTIAGNKSPYTVLGKTYRVMLDATEYQQQGIASWYGRKFHGRNTSNGEVYDMYAMTAAHKSLPIPSYVQVTNLQNGKKVVVRVNDRGPFHGDRIIDLSYAAAYRLGFVNKGTAPVEVILLNPENPVPAQPAQKPLLAMAQSATKAPAKPKDAYDRLTTFAQAGAFSGHGAAVNLRDRLASLLNYPVFIDAMDTATKLYRVRVGPIIDEIEFINIQQIMATHNLGVPHLVRE